MKIGYQGIEGAYSEAAVYQHYGKGVKPIGYGTFEEVFEAVKKGKVDLGCLPFENAIAGSVVMNYDLLLKQDVFIIAEVFFKISHSALKPIINHPNFRSEELQKLLNNAYREFYFRFSYIVSTVLRMNSWLKVKYYFNLLPAILKLSGY